MACTSQEQTGPAGVGVGGGALTLVVAATGSGGSGTGACSFAGQTRPCYEGEMKHAGVGACVYGTETCAKSGEFLSWQPCKGWVAPASEICGDAIDSDCDGNPHNGCAPMLGFAPPGYANVGKSPRGILTGDFNGDGKADLAVAAYGGSLGVLLGDGKGTFPSGTSYGLGINAQAIAAGDFNGDGVLDLVVAGPVDPNVGPGSAAVVFKGKPDGTFFNAVEQKLISYGTSSLVAGHWNNDGELDLAVAGNGAPTVQVLLGNGDLTFQPAVAAYANVAQFYGLMTGDWNGDGKQDLATASVLKNDVHVLVGDGMGGFQNTATIATAVDPETLMAADVNGDGKADLITASRLAKGTVSVLLGNGDATFKTAVDHPTSPYPDGIVAGDFDGDGKLDLAHNGGFTGDNPKGYEYVTILRRDGVGGFAAPQPYVASVLGVSSYSRALTAGDWNGDGKLDLATTNFSGSNIHILVNTSSF